MHKLSMLLTILGIAAALSGCNSTDALTPQVDVGGGTFRSPPVSQTDLDRMAAQSDYPAQETRSVRSAPLSTASSETFGTGSDGTVMAQGDADYTDPAGSLDAQAGRLQQGETPLQERTARRAAIPAESNADTASVSDASTDEADIPARETAQSSETSEPVKAASVAPSSDPGAIRFLPIIGAPVEAVTPLSKELGLEARARGLTIKAGSDPATQHILKGYFSAFKDSGKTTVVYVWDVLDGSGNRLHRIQGQDTVDAITADLWSAIPAETMQAIAKKTIDAYLDWRAGQAG